MIEACTLSSRPACRRPRRAIRLIAGVREFESSVRPCITAQRSARNNSSKTSARDGIDIHQTFLFFVMQNLLPWRTHMSASGPT